MKNAYDEFKKSKNDRVIKSTIGLTKKEFDYLLIYFEKAYHLIQKERLESGEIKHLPKGGIKGFLYDFEIKLFFILFYLKNYPTFDVLGAFFGFGSGHAYEHVSRLFPVLQRALAELGLLPQSTVTSVDEIRQLIDKNKIIIVDATECPCVRPSDSGQQKLYYSGKKKAHPQSLINH